MNSVCRRISHWGAALCLCIPSACLPQLTAATKNTTGATTAVNVSSGVASGLRISGTAPVYPPIAKAARISGTVVLSAVISAEGTIADLEVVSGPPLLQQAAIDAVATWRYRPFFINGKPVSVRTQINVIFTLDGLSPQTANAAAGSSSNRPPTVQGYHFRHFSWNYQYDSNGQPRRDWYEQNNAGWLEVSPNGILSRFYVMKAPFLVHGISGKLLIKDDKTIYVFVPEQLQSGNWLTFWPAKDVNLDSSRPWLISVNGEGLRLGQITVYEDTEDAWEPPVGSSGQGSAPAQAAARPQAALTPTQPAQAPQTAQAATPEQTPPPQQTDDGASQRVALEQQKQDIADKISDLQSDMEEQQSEADNWDQTAQNLQNNSNCSGPGAALCESIGQIGVNKAEANARKAREAAQRDQEQINDLQGQINDLDQQISTATSAPAAQQPASDPNAIVNAGNQQAAQIRAIGDANAAARANKNAVGSTGSSAAPTGHNSKECVDQNGKPIPGSENWKACPGW